jgi:hypothetical protein
VQYADRWTTVRVEIDEGVAWVELNRPEKRNAMSPTLNAEMVEVLLALDADDDCGVLVLTGAGDSWSAGMDLKEYFREVDGGPEHVPRRVRPPEVLRGNPRRAGDDDGRDLQHRPESEAAERGANRERRRSRRAHRREGGAAPEESVAGEVDGGGEPGEQKAGVPQPEREGKRQPR